MVLFRSEPVALPKRTPPRERDALGVPGARRAADEDSGPREAPGSLFQPASRRNRPEERFAPVAEDVRPAETAFAAEAGPAGPGPLTEAGPVEAEAVAEAGPVAAPASEPAFEPASEPVFESAPEPALEPAPEPVSEPAFAPEGESEGEAGDDREEGPEDDLAHDRAPAGAPEAEDLLRPAAESDDDREDHEGHEDHDGDESHEGDDDRAGAGAVQPGRKSLHALVDGVFANAEDKRWAVAQNRLFSDAPATVEALAKLFAVSPEVIAGIETDLRRELDEWIASDEAAPYREHLEEVKGILGKAAPRERLIDAAEWHTLELHSLDVPAWQFVLACLPGYHLVDEWLVEGDITELRHRTRDMISGAKPPLTINKALDMVSSLGIHPEVSKKWLENVPQLRILGAGERPPQRSNGAPALTAEKPADVAGGIGGPPDGGETGQEPKKAPFRPLKDVSLTRRCFRQPDGRWWLRIDVTPEHLGGAECPLPSGFAAYLGMSPGDGRTVSSAVGELVLSWQDRPVLESLMTLLEDVGAREGSHLFLTLSDEGVLRARHLPAAGEEVEATARALRLVGYTAAGGTAEQAGRVIATRVGMTGPVATPELLTRLRERGDRDLLSLLA